MRIASGAHTTKITPTSPCGVIVEHSLSLLRAERRTLNDQDRRQWQCHSK